MKNVILLEVEDCTIKSGLNNFVELACAEIGFDEFFEEDELESISENSLDEYFSYPECLLRITPDDASNILRQVNEE